MFRTGATTFRPERMPRIHPTATHRLRSTDLRLRWTVREGRLVSSWRREPQGIAEAPTRRGGHLAA